MSEDDKDLTPGPEDAPQIDEPEPEIPSTGESPEGSVGAGATLDEPPGPINWNLLTSEQAELQWLELNAWVNWLRHTYGLPVSVIPPMWHRHPELVWELSALHTHWLCAYDPEQNGSAPIGWHRDFADTRQRLRDWIQASGTRLDRDRPTRQTTWPGEDPAETVEETPIENRDEDFVDFVLDDVVRRKAKEDEIYARINQETGEVT